jgi:DNA-binding FadR family transcriptional regulator
MPATARAIRRGAPLRPRAGSDAKRAAKLADRIVGDVMALGWPVGEVLGSEAELLARYSVSRAVFREAVRLVENQQVARTRRGPGGGLVITEPTVDAVIDAVVLYLHRVDARLDEVFEARITLEDLAADLAAARVDEHDLAKLRTFVDGDPKINVDPRALHSLVASISRNPALELFVEVLNRVAVLYSSEWRSFGSTVAADTDYAHARIAAAVIAGDAGLTRHRMRRHLEAEADYLRKRRSTRQLMPDQVVLGDSHTGKRAESVARHITVAVVGEGMQPGQLVGTETELIEREGVSRAVLREAVRLLEHHQIARMRRGPGGGLFVAEPSAAAVTEIAAIYLARRGMRLTDLAELRAGVELAIVGFAADRIDAAGVARLREALEREESSSDAERVDAVHDLHAAVAAAAHNQVLELVSLVLIRLSRLYQIERLAPKTRREIKAEVFRTHAGIAAAVEAGDRELARHRMRRHLDALGAVMH